MHFFGVDIDLYKSGDTDDKMDTEIFFISEYVRYYMDFLKCIFLISLIDTACPSNSKFTEGFIVERLSKHLSPHLLTCPTWLPDVFGLG